MEVGKLILNRYIKGIVEGQPAAWSKSDRNVVSMALIGDDPAMTYGIMRCVPVSYWAVNKGSHLGSHFVCVPD